MPASNSLNISQPGYVVFDGVATFTGRTFQAGTGITLTNPDGIAGNTTIALTGSGAAVEHLTGDTGGTLNPDGSNNFNLLGQKAGTIAVMDTIGSGSTINFEDRTWTTSLVVDPSSTVGLRGTFTTISLAMTAAVSGQTIFIRPGTYTENVTLKAGVNLSSFVCDAPDAQVTIIGFCTATFTGSCSLSGINFQTTAGGSAITVSGSNATVVNLTNCFISALTNPITAILNSASNTGAIINLLSCRGDVSIAGGVSIYQNTGTGIINFYSCFFTNSIANTGSSTHASGIVNIYSSSFYHGLAVSGTGVLNIFDSSVITSAPNSNSLTVNSNSGASIICSNCYLESGTASAIFLTGSNAIVNSINSTINSSNTNAIVRGSSTPTIKYGNLSFIGSSSLIDPTLTQVPFVKSNDAVRITTPGAYPYTTVPQDGVILVDSTSARTIVPLASPTTGQVHRIKDNVGSAAANNITITPSGKNIDGSASFVIGTNWGSVDIVFNGVQWNCL